MMVPKWGYWGKEPPCEHLVALRTFLEGNQMEITSEHGIDPSGWVNVSGESCSRTYETVLRPPWADDPNDEEYPEDEE